MNTRYFGGLSVRDGRVHLLQAKTFKDLVESYIYVPVVFPMTRAAFNALSEDERNARKDGAYICCASYDFDEGKRENHTATSMTLAIFDIDDAQQARDFFESPATLREALLGYNFAAYTTAKHTPDAPRLKIVVDVAPCDPAAHRRIVKMLSRCLGLPAKFKGERESLTLSLPQYRPLAFREEEFTSVIASRLDGVPVLETHAPETAEDAEEGGRIYAYDGDDISDLAFMPAFGLSVEDISEPLFAVDADSPYQIWTHIACALRHNFPGEEQAREAFEKFVQWSMTGSKFKSEADCYAKWRSFKPYAQGRRPITIASLYKYAMDSGWVNTKLAAKVRTHVSDWIKACDNADELLAEGSKRIAEMPFKNAMVEEMLCGELRAKLKGMGVTISQAGVLKQVRKDRRDEVTAEVREEKPPWMLPFCFIGPDNIFRNNINGTKYSPESFNNTFSRFLTPEAADGVDSDTTRPLVLPSNKALNETKIKVVDAELYDPRESSGREPYFDLKGKTFVNTYLHSSLPEITEQDISLSKKAGKLMRRLIAVNVGDKGYERTVLDVLAFVVQRPGILLRWSIFMQGAQGCGKGTLFDDCMIAALGQPNVKIITAAAMTSTFDDWRSGSQWCHIDEIKAPGKNRFEVVNRVKDAITNSVIPVNQKFKDIVNIPNVTNYVMSSNTIDALALEDSDRRFFVLISRIQTREQVLALNDSGLIQEIHALVLSNPGAFRHYLLNHVISEDFPVNGPAPETRYRQDLIDGAKNALQAMIERLIAAEDQPLIGADVIHLARLEALTEYQARDNARVTHYLRVLGFEKWGEAKVHGEKTEIWTHPQRFVEGFEDPDEILESRYSDDI